MNFNDIYKQAIKLQEELAPIKDIMLQLEEILNTVVLHDTSIKFYILKNDIAGGNYTSSANQIKTDNMNFYNSFTIKLRSINFVQPAFTLAALRNKYEFFNLNNFIDRYSHDYSLIQKHISNVGESDQQIYIETIQAVQNILKLYEKILSNIDQIVKVNEILNPYNSDEKNTRIRFMNENKSIDGLINNITIVKRIYTSVNELLGNDEELTYNRVESGTFQIDLNGCIQTLAVMVPILTLSYGVYSQQFSPKAKLERKKLELEIEEKKIKIRGDYIKLIKETCPEKDIDFSNPKVQENLLNLEVDVKQLYCKNPCIRVDDNEIGVEALRDGEIPIQFLESVMEKTIEDVKLGNNAI